MRISILSNVNLDMLSGLLKKEHEIFQTDGYGKWITYALGREEALSVFAPECLFLILDGTALLGACSDEESRKKELDRTSLYIEKLAENYSGSYLVVSTIDVRPECVRAKDTADTALAASAYWDGLLEKLAAEHGNIHRLELRQLIEDCGRAQFYSDKFWYMGSIPYDMKALHLLAAEMQRVLLKLRQTPKKVLVLDLDNTLWGGVIGEDGPEGIVLDSAHEGAIYQDAQKEIKKMQQQGVILAAASKNNPEDVQRAFRENPHMILKEEDFAMLCADWKPKHENVKRIAKTLNLGLDSFVFVDDNEAEREAMRIHLPEVTVADFPADLTQLAAFMKTIYDTYFWSWRLTEEDKVKTRQYREEKQRQEELDASVSYEAYLKSLDTKIRLAELKPETTERAVQLMNKTNQFNTNTLRMDEPELMRYLKEEQGHLILAEVSDKYGNSGWVSEFMYHIKEDTSVVDNFLMSCRVMGRKVEDAILKAILERLAEQGIKSVLASYRKTAKNKPVEELWEQMGFERAAGDETYQEYHFNLQEMSSLKGNGELHTVFWDGD